METEALELPQAIDTSEISVSAPTSLDHRDLRRDEFWKKIPAYQNVAANEFQTHLFQARQTVTNLRQLRETLQYSVPESFYLDVEQGLRRAPMALR